MKISFIFVLYKTPKKEVLRLKKEVKDLGFSDYQIHFFDNSHNGQGFGFGVNKGICAGLNSKADLFILSNSDISFLPVIPSERNESRNPFIVRACPASGACREPFDFAQDKQDFSTPRVRSARRINKITANDFITTSKYFDVFSFAMKQDGEIYYGGEIERWRMSGGLIKKKPRKQFAKCDFVSAMMVVKREVIEKIGFLREDYFMYYEDVEFCFRAKQAGLKVGIDSSKYYEHFEVSKNNKMKDHYLFWNRIKFMRQYGTAKQKIREILRLPKTILEIVNSNNQAPRNKQ